MSPRNYWIGVASSDHVALAVAGGYVQLNRGKAGPLERMRAGDALAFYSPRASYPNGAAVQAFTAIGVVTGDPIYQAEAANDVAPFRRRVVYVASKPAPIRPLIDALTFIRSKLHWGASFRFGIVRIPEHDFATIAHAMGSDFAASAAPPAAAAAA